MTDKPNPKVPKDEKAQASPRNVPSARAKPSGHKKMTADKWNQ
jgi:hypothetical protein